MDNNCYTYRSLELPSGKLDKCVDATIVLTMEKSDRHQQILKEVQTAGLTSNVFFQVNEGYKKCKKNIEKQSSEYDLNHALKTAFKFALNNNFKRILVLEDDCEFDHDSLAKPQTTADICSFMERVNPEVYNLGQPIGTVVPYGIKHVKMVGYVNGTQSIMYNREHMLKRLETKDKTPHVDFALKECNDKYAYYRPLTAQRFEETENSDTWGEIFGLSYFKISNIALNLFGFRTNPIRGANLLYFSTLVAIYSIILLILRYLYLKFL